MRRLNSFLSNCNYDKHNKGNQRKEVIDRYVNFVLLVIQEKLEWVIVK